jgi:hypothetical protein
MAMRLMSDRVYCTTAACPPAGGAPAGTTAAASAASACASATAAGQGAALATLGSLGSPSRTSSAPRLAPPADLAGLEEVLLLLLPFAVGGLSQLSREMTAPAALGPEAAPPPLPGCLRLLPPALLLLLLLLTVLPLAVLTVLLLVLLLLLLTALTAFFSIQATATAGSTGQEKFSVRGGVVMWRAAARRGAEAGRVAGAAEAEEEEEEEEEEEGGSSRAVLWAKGGGGGKEGRGE